MIKRILPAALIAVMMAGGDACARSWKNVYLTPTLVMKNIRCETRNFKFTVVNRAKQRAPKGLAMAVKWLDPDGDPLPFPDTGYWKRFVDLEQRRAVDLRIKVSHDCSRIGGWEQKLGRCTDPERHDEDHTRRYLRHEMTTYTPKNCKWTKTWFPFVKPALIGRVGEKQLTPRVVGRVGEDGIIILKEK